MTVDNALTAALNSRPAADTPLTPQQQAEEATIAAAAALIDRHHFGIFNQDEVPSAELIARILCARGMLTSPDLLNAQLDNHLGLHQARLRTAVADVQRLTRYVAALKRVADVLLGQIDEVAELAAVSKTVKGRQLLAQAKAARAFYGQASDAFAEADGAHRRCPDAAAPPPLTRTGGSQSKCEPPARPPYGGPVNHTTNPQDACRTTQHCAYHGWCRRCDPAFAETMSQINVAIQRTDADESHWGPLYEAVGKALCAAAVPSAAETADRATVYAEVAEFVRSLAPVHPKNAAWVQDCHHIADRIEERACPTPESHNWGCGCPTDEQPAVGEQPDTQTREALTLPPPEGPEYTPCICDHIEPEHAPDHGRCRALRCGCSAYRPTPPAPLLRSEDACPGFPERCPNLRPVDPQPPVHLGGIRCGCADTAP